MSVEFVEPGASTATPTAPVVRTSPVPGRVLGAAAAVAGVVTLVALQVSLYAVVRTASIVDFDGTTTRVARIPVDAYGHSAPVPVDSARGPALSDVGVAVRVPDGISYAPWWLGLGIALLAAGVWGLLRPRSAALVAVVAALGGVLLGSLGAAWLSARAVSRTSVPQIRFDASPGPGLWLLVAAGGLALLAPLLGLAALRLHPRRRRAQ